jgi:NitT/TauT family transport system permease protein
MSALRRWAAGQGAAVLTLMALLVLWEAAVVGLDIQRFLLPAPSDVVAEFIKDYRMIFGHAVQTVWGILAGYIAAVIFALAASMAMIRWPLVERMVMPIFVASQSVPKIAIAPLILLWIGAGAGSKILVVASIAFFPVVINTMAGFKQVDQGLMDVFRSVDATSRQTFLRLRLPYAVPYIFAGLRIATTLAVLGAIVAEWLAATDGIGYLVLSGSFNFNTARSFAAIILLTVIGMSFFGAMGAVERALSWRRPAEEATRVQA